ncbi:MAG: tRNA preQ1(34) S-adenosylmethionine ribosyltransferase-isomerase QueA [Thermoguttaceae bacterium]|nr:tRNA preQ1(34) S-adenosylmethionine ribosyltransferase-isomerase QueA [Thermoguttaceae bacterium]MDW8037879.1 tRNA preQ1(34) S-adenosylmethionine ribosyltransferase-isomerase QueA [Thermoguttaceae bacterium]
MKKRQGSEGFYPSEWMGMTVDELAHYDYHLPKRLIAQAPLPNRADARMMVLRRADQTLEHWHVRDLPELLRPGDCLVLNDSKVIPARLVGYRESTGGRWEGLFLEAWPNGFWKILARCRGKPKPDEPIVLINRFGKEDIRLFIGTKLPEEGVWIVRPETSEDPFVLLERVGRVPLPPYIRRGEMREADRTWYQTVYASVPGSIAAPTAGLHFTPALLDRLKKAGIEICRITLHVGVGTFRPIKTTTLSEHKMHSEWGQITPETVARLVEARQKGGRIVAVGTTCVRLLETAAADGQLKPFSGYTELFIRPPYQFRAVDALLTNFHLPRTTLLVLVRTFGGDELVRRAYEEAIRLEYRFYSYGDCMLIL